MRGLCCIGFHCKVHICDILLVDILQTCPGLEQYSIKKFAESFEALPMALAENTGVKVCIGMKLALKFVVGCSSPRIVCWTSDHLIN